MVTRRKKILGAGPAAGPAASASSSTDGTSAFRVVPSAATGHSPTCSSSNSAAAGSAPWTPTGYTSFKVLLSARLCAAVWTNISDCDETYNYWEPTHYILHGTGFQTWEYSPAYALRSFAYIWLHALPLWIYQTLLQGNKLLVFYALRCLLGLVSASCEAYFYKGVVQHYGSQTGRILLLMLLFCPGMFISSTAYLPSSFAMYMTMIATSAYLQSHYRLAIGATAAGALIGWPFAAITGIHIAVDLVLRKKDFFYFLKWSLFAGFLFSVPMLMIDSYYYGKMVFAPLNIVMYNVFTQHGPDIYGTEPWTFYFINGILNFNVAFPLALVSLPICTVIQYHLRNKHAEFHASTGRAQKNKCSTCNVNQVPFWLVMLPMYLWFLVFFTRPHKEERFLFPVYPLILFAASSALDSIQRFLAHTLPWLKNLTTHYTAGTNWLPTVFIFAFIGFGTSRCVSLYQNYHAPMDVYMQLHSLYRDTPPLPAKQTIRLCAGKEWYRYPSSFFLPTDQWEFRFVQSEFRAQLPNLYQAPPPSGSKLIPDYMNDQNLEEPSRYVNVSSCHLLIDLDSPPGGETENEPRYSDITNAWKSVYSEQFLDSSRSHPFFRAFYLPFLSTARNSFLEYHLLEDVSLDKNFVK